MTTKASKEIIGHIDCPVCGHNMPIKADKNGHAYGHCAHRCNAQVFTRNDHRDSLLRQRMRPVTVTVTVTEEKKPDPITVPVFVPPAPAPAPAPKPAPAPRAKPADGEAAPKSTWFQPLLSKGGKPNGRA